MFWRLAISYTLLILAAVGLLDLAVLGRVERHYLDEVEGDLRARAALAREAVRGLPPDARRERVAALRRDAGTRITLLADDGRVLADSDEDPAQMDNHADRPEVRQARDGRYGAATRFSATVHHPMMYVALRADGSDGVGYVRVAVPLGQVRDRLADLRLIAATAALLTGAAASALAFWLARRITRPLQELAAAAGDVAGGAFGRRVSAAGSGEVSALAGAFNHMSARLAGQFAQLEEDRQQLRRLERVRQEFVANVSHELKTPLSVIKAAVETLLDGAADDPEARGVFLGQIAEQADRLHALILDLLSLARIEAGAEGLEFAAVPVGAVVSACLERHRTRAEAKGQALEAVPPAGEVAAWADEEALGQILDNLVDNAVKYTPAGGRIRVRWRADGPDVCLEVEDTGIGIPAADLPRVFERFYRVDKARSRELGGTGLGLSIVKHLAQAMKGSVSAASQPGRGTTFTVRLPRPGAELP